MSNSIQAVFDKLMGHIDLAQRETDATKKDALLSLMKCIEDEFGALAITNALNEMAESGDDDEAEYKG